jgi:serine/threonine-protein kinase
MIAAMSLPARLGPYRVLGLLGRGGMAEVLRAEAFGASGFVQEVALKVLPVDREGIDVAGLEKLLVEEARLGATLQHPNLIAVHELGVDDGVYYVRMELVDGADLATLARGEPLSAPHALYVAEAVALALAYVHAATDERGLPRGLVHRDVSPQNVLVARHGHVKLGDFGIAKQTHASTTTQANFRRGKYAYMSPEQLARAPLSSASDQFGLGVMLYELLVGARPYEGETPLVVIDKIKLAAPPNVRALPDDVGEVVLRCLSREPRDRFASTEALARTLAQLRRMHPLFTALDSAAWVAERLARAGEEPAKDIETRPLTNE